MIWFYRMASPAEDQEAGTLDPWGPILGVLFEDESSDYILEALQRAVVPTAFGLTQEEAFSNKTRKRAYKRRLDPDLRRAESVRETPCRRESCVRNREIAAHLGKTERRASAPWLDLSERCAKPLVAR